VAGRNVSHSHKVTNRVVEPNIQSVRIRVHGRVKKANVCTKCLKAGKVTRA
jgi:large subunit ribosomal protein L28